MYDEKCLQNIGGNIRFLRMACQIGQTHMSNLECNRVKVSLKLLRVTSK